MEVIAQRRIGNRILEHVRAIAVPRFPGTNGERKARAYIRNSLQQAGYSLDEHEFSSSLFPFEILPRLMVALVSSVAVLGYALLPSFPALSIELAILSMLLLAVGTRWNPLVEKLYRLKKFGTVRSANIIGLHPRRENHVNVVFTAHYDSKSQTFSGMVRFFLIALFAACVMVVGAGIIAAVFLPVVRSWLLIALLPLCITSLLLQVNGTHNASPGAFDNASGVGVLLELANAFSHENPDVNLAFVATGAEEAGLCGAVTLMQDGRFLEHFPSTRSIIINIDGVGVKGPLRVTDRYGFPPAHTGKELSALCLKIADRFGISCKRNWMPAGAGLDHIPFATHGYQTVTLSSAGWNHAFRAMHTKNDLVDHLSIQPLEHVYAVCQEIVDSIPAIRPLSAN